MIEILDTIMTRASKRLEKKHNMSLIGIGEGMMESVKTMCFRFQIYRPLEKSEARAIIVDSVLDFLADINQDEEIRQYLDIYPCDVNHVEVFLFINTPERGEFYDPNLSVVSAYMGEIVYSTNDPDKPKISYKSHEIESFEDAVKILKGETPTNP